MRISADRNDSGYAKWNDSMAGHVRVFLNDKLVKGALTADSFLGEVVVFQRDLDGYWIIDRAKDEVVRETLKGEVRIEFDEGFEPA